MEKVTARNSDVHMTGRVSAHKRKREKAQDQLRHRMRKRNNGTTEPVVSSRLRISQRDKIEGTTGQGLRTVWNNVAHKELKDQESHYSPLTHPGRAAGTKLNRQSAGDIPLSELVSRVIHRTSQTTTDRLPMTIRALKPPVPPYGFHQHGILRKIPPVSRRKPTGDGPYVFVLNRSPSVDKRDQREHHANTNLPPLKQHTISGDVEIATWRPTLNTHHEPYVHPNAEDRFVTNYRLQMQQAIKIAELRCDFSTSSKPMHKHAPLPAIQVAYEVADQPQIAQNPSADDQVGVSACNTEPQSVNAETYSKTNDAQDTAPTTNEDRFTSSQEVLQQMQARKHAKRRTVKGEEFNNPLRTRNRFTTKMKMFKEDLQKTRELSIIQEDQSSISERLSKLSAGRTSAASFRSAGSLKRIEETDAATLNLGKCSSDTNNFMEEAKIETTETNTSPENGEAQTNGTLCASGTCNIHVSDSDLVLNRGEQPTSTQSTDFSICKENVNESDKRNSDIAPQNSRKFITQEQCGVQVSDSICLLDDAILNENRNLPNILWHDETTDSD